MIPIYLVWKFTTTVSGIVGTGPKDFIYQSHFPTIA